MQIHWLIFFPALVLLFYPLDALLRGGVRFRDYERTREQLIGGKTAGWRQLLLWLDPLRAFLGGWLLLNSWQTDPLLPGVWNYLPFLGALAVLGAAVFVQMHTRRDDAMLLAPVGYLSGLAFALLPPAVAVLVVVFAGACLMAFRGWGAFFFFGSVASGVFGYLVLKVNLWMLAAVLLMIQPLLVSMLLGRRLLLPVMLNREELASRESRRVRRVVVQVSHEDAPDKAIGAHSH